MSNNFDNNCEVLNELRNTQLRVIGLAKKCTKTPKKTNESLVRRLSDVDAQLGRLFCCENSAKHEIDTLDPLLQKIFKMYYVDNLKPKDIAKNLHITHVSRYLRKGGEKLSVDGVRTLEELRRCANRKIMLQEEKANLEALLGITAMADNTKVSSGRIGDQTASSAIELVMVQEKIDDIMRRFMDLYEQAMAVFSLINNDRLVKFLYEYYLNPIKQDNTLKTWIDLSETYNLNRTTLMRYVSEAKDLFNQNYALLYPEG